MSSAPPGKPSASPRASTPRSSSGVAVNGNQANQTFTVNYADGTTQTFTQSLSDWFSPQNYTGESKAVTMAYRDLANGTKQNRPFYVYGYSFSLNATKTVSSITLPNDANVKLLSVTLSTATSVPTAPSNLAATAGNGQVTLSWTGTSGATSYNVYRGTTSGQEGCCIRASAARRIPTARPPTARPTSTRSRPSTPSARAANRTRSPPRPRHGSYAGEPGGLVQPRRHRQRRLDIHPHHRRIDGGGAALSANLLGTSQTWNGTPFTIGAPGSSNVVSATGQTISLPAGQYASLQFLALAVNGNQANQTFTVHYADGTTQTFTQSLSDWFRLRTTLASRRR